MMSKDDDVILFHKNAGFIGDFSNAAESTHSLLSILEYCVSDEMHYCPETKAKVQELIDWIDAAAEKGELIDA